MTSLPRLISIGPSHYCEKVRWAMELAGIAYTEDRHSPLFHLWHVRRAGGRHSTPLLVLSDRLLTDSTDILQWVAELPESRWRPWQGEDPEVRRIEELCDQRIGPHSRRLAYGLLMPHLDLFCSAAAAGGPLERALFGLLARPIRALMRRGLGIHPAGVQRSREKLDAVATELEALLADGRRYLVGDRFTGADLTLAALAAPLVLPPAYGAPLPAFSSLPEAAAQELQAWRERPLGRFVLRLYEEERRGGR